MIKRFFISYAAGILILATFVGLVGYNTNQELETTMTELFNRQQLILARQIAHDITNHFRFLETGLLTLNAEALTKARADKPLSPELTSLSRQYASWQVLAIGYVPLNKSHATLIQNSEVRVDPDLGLNIKPFLSWVDNPASQGRIVFGRTEIPDSGLFQHRRIKLMATPAPSRSGLIFFVIDVQALAQQHARSVRSGKTGYAWVIDQDGTFLSHFEDSFIGKNTFTVRKQRNSELSYSRIDELVRDNLLKGQEGMDWYASGWHRGSIGEMKKLLAYSPIWYAGVKDSAHLWSVGLAAPTTEVYGILQPFLLKQWFISGVILVIVFSGLGVLIFFSLRWTEILRKEVGQKTSDLLASERAIRLERDKVQEGMQRLIDTQEKLVRSERFAAIGQAAAHLAHEIKNPLMIMGGFAAQVRKNVPPDGPQSHKLQIIEDEAKRLEAMLMEVQGFTRPTKPQIASTNLNAVIEETLDMMEGSLAEKEISLVRSLAPTLPKTMVDGRQMKQVLLNLVKNAAEATPSRGTVTVASRLDQDWIRISVTDTGMGMPPEVLKNIFSPFFTTKAKGTGLGLVVCYRIMEDHGGDINVTSVPGRGSSFVLSVPLAGNLANQDSPDPTK